MSNRCSRVTATLVVLSSLSLTEQAFGQQGRADADPLQFWNDGTAKDAIRKFVSNSTDKANPQYVPPEERIATFDQDGTLWVSHPLYTQAIFAIDRVKALASQHPEWKTQEPFRAILSDDHDAMTKFTEEDWTQILAETHSSMTVEEFHALVKKWLDDAKHPCFQLPYTDLVYQPMLELMKYLRANGFKTYIVSGGGQEFIRAYAEKVYGVPPEQVIGTAEKPQYKYTEDGRPILVRQPKLLLHDDGTGKPVGINLVIGRRPVAAFGNSDGDQQMLEWTQGPLQHPVAGARLMLLVHHDDGYREFAYDKDTKVGTFSDALMTEAKDRGWTVVSMKNDWNRVFSFEKLPKCPPPR